MKPVNVIKRAAIGAFEPFEELGRQLLVDCERLDGYWGSALARIAGASILKQVSKVNAYGLYDLLGAATCEAVHQNPTIPTTSHREGVLMVVVRRASSAPSRLCLQNILEATENVSQW